MHKFTHLLVLFFTPLSSFMLCNDIWAQTDSLKIQLEREKSTKFYHAITTMPDSAVIGFTVTLNDEMEFFFIKPQRPTLADSLKKDFMPDNLRDSIFNFREKMKLKRHQLDSTISALTNKPIPDFDARDTMGLVHRPANYRGRVLLLHFFNFWDYSFDNEIPVLNNLMERYNSKGLEIISFMDIGITHSERKWLKEHPINFPLITDARLFMRQFLPVTKQIPYVVLVDKAGNFRYFYLKNVINPYKRRAANGQIGEKEKLISFDEWEEKIVQLLEESKF
jgi:peroxiredoxin